MCNSIAAFSHCFVCRALHANWILLVSFTLMKQQKKLLVAVHHAYSDCGSLPLVADLQEAGFDVQVSESCSVDHPKQNNLYQYQYVTSVFYR